MKIRSGTTGLFIHNTIVTSNEVGIECAQSALLIDRVAVVAATPLSSCQQQSTQIGTDTEELGLNDNGRTDPTSPLIDAAVPQLGDPAELRRDFDGDERSTNPDDRTDVGADERVP